MFNDYGKRKIVGIDRVSIDQVSYEKPEIFVQKFNFSKQSRSIASTPEIGYIPNLSNRQLYFLTYYKQYLSLANTLGMESEITICPSFHNVMLDYKNDIAGEKGEYTTQLSLEHVRFDKNELPKFPVLSLPTENNEDLYTTLTKNNWENSNQHLRSSLEYYLEIEKKELETLCETGVSDNYYVFENLVKYFNNDKKFHRTTNGLKAVLKIPVVANMLILDNLKRTNYTRVSNSNFEQWLMHRSDLKWFGEYQNNLAQARKLKISALKN